MHAVLTGKQATGLVTGRGGGTVHVLGDEHVPAVPICHGVGCSGHGNKQLRSPRPYRQVG